MEEEIQTLNNGAMPDISCHQFADGEWRRSSVAVPKEMALNIFINGQELVTTLCTPTKLNCLVLGFLVSEGIITGMSDTTSMRVCEDESLAEVRLKTEFSLPKKRILTSGCGGGVGFTEKINRINSDIMATPTQLLSLMKRLLAEAELYQFSGGVHTSALCEGENILVMAEDVGRHNTLDKILGECMLRKVATKDKILLTTGRLSSEILRKAAKMEIPIVVSLTSPTERAILLARDAGITLVGYARGRYLSVYSCADRLVGAVQS